jgi:hypothetical protein
VFGVVPQPPKLNEGPVTFVSPSVLWTEVTAGAVFWLGAALGATSDSIRAMISPRQFWMFCKITITSRKESMVRVTCNGCDFVLLSFDGEEKSSSSKLGALYIHEF